MPKWVSSQHSPTVPLDFRVLLLWGGKVRGRRKGRRRDGEVREGRKRGGSGRDNDLDLLYPEKFPTYANARGWGKIWRFKSARISLLPSQTRPNDKSSTSAFMLPFCHTTIRQKCICYQGPSIWNSLPSHIKLVDSTAASKILHQQYLINRY